jgi:ABC-2 type transport system ATP-binding protein
MLEVRHLSKQFFGTLAVNDVSFQARPGEVTGYLGPNGSGKSTTIKIIAGLIEPSAGAVLFRGEPVRHDLISWKSRIGYVPEEPHLYLHLSGLEYLTMVGELRGLQPAILARRIEGMLHLLSLTPSRDIAIASYSKGMRQKVLLAAALLHDPELLLLDEPFSGLDVNSALILRQVVIELAARGKVVLFSSHELETVERVSSRVVILHRGRVVADDAIDGLRALMSLPTLEQIFAELAVEQDPAAAAREMADLICR